MSGNDFYQDASFDTKAWTLGTTLLANSLDATPSDLGGVRERVCKIVHRRPAPVALRNSPAGSRYDNKCFGRVRRGFGKFEGEVDGKGGSERPQVVPQQGV